MRRSGLRSSKNHPCASGQTRVPTATPEFAEPPWRRKAEPLFYGDAANVALRRRLAESSEPMPEPLLLEVSRPRLPFGRLIGTMLVVGATAVSYWLGSGSGPSTPAPRAAPVSDRAEMMMRSSPSASAQAVTADVSKRIDAQPARLAEAARNEAATAEAPPGPTPATADTPAALAPLLSAALPTFAEAAADAQPPPAPSGLPSAIGSPGTSASVPRASASAGVRNMTSGEDGGATSGATGPARKLSAAEADLMIQRGSLFMANGNVAAARMILQPAAEAGVPAAAFALAETYDPLVLDRLGVKGGIAPNLALAQVWYERARDLGSTVAPRRIEMLARLGE
jgi:hypothetical protein